MERRQVRGRGDNGDAVALALPRRMREILPLLHEVVNDAEAAGNVSPAKIAELRARLQEAERDVEALEAADRDDESEDD